jgi:hypothetical protein
MVVLLNSVLRKRMQAFSHQCTKATPNCLSLPTTAPVNNIKYYGFSGRTGSPQEIVNDHRLRRCTRPAKSISRNAIADHRAHAPRSTTKFVQVLGHFAIEQWIPLDHVYEKDVVVTLVAEQRA